MTRLCIFTVLALLSMAPADASSPAAWAENERAATRACTRASGLAGAVVLPKRVGFPDTLGLDAMLVRGTWAAGAVKGRRATMLCLYRRATRQATLVEAEGWTVR